MQSQSVGFRIPLLLFSFFLPSCCMFCWIGRVLHICSVAWFIGVDRVVFNRTPNDYGSHMGVWFCLQQLDQLWFMGSSVREGSRSFTRGGERFEWNYCNVSARIAWSVTTTWLSNAYLSVTGSVDIEICSSVRFSL